MRLRPSIGPLAWAAPRAARPAPGAVLHGAARPRAGGRGAGRGAARRLRSRQPGGRASAPRRRGARPRGGRSVRHGYAPFRALPALREAIAARYRDVYGVELDPRDEVAIGAWHQDGARRARAGARRARAAHAAPDPGYPDYPSGVALAGAELVPLPLERDGRLGARLRVGARGGCRLPELPVEPVRRRRAGRRIRRRGRATPSGRARSSSTTSPTATSSSTAAADELPRHTGRARGRRRDVLDVQDVRHGRLAARLRRRQRRDRRRGSTC